MGTSINAWYLVLAAFLVVIAYRGIKAGRFGSAQDEKLSSNRLKEPFWFWAQALLILACSVVLIWAAFI